MPNRTSHNPFFCLILLAWSVAASALGDTVVLHLKNGDHLTGKIAVEDLSKVVLITTWSTNVVVPLSAIDKREKIPETPPAATITLPGDNTNHPAAVVTTNGAPAKPATTTVMSNGVAVIKVGTNLPPITAKPPKRWNFDTQVGLNLQYNKKESELFYGAFKANYGFEQFRQIIDFKVNYGKSAGVISANNMYLNYRDEYDITKNKRAFLFNAVGAGEDQIRKIHSYFDESFGTGYKFIDHTNFVLSGDTGLNYQRQYLYNKVTKNSASMRFGEVLTWKINPRLTFDQKFEFYPTLASFDEFHSKATATVPHPAVAGLGDYRARFEANVSYKLNATGNIYCNLTMIDAYDTKPAAGVTQNDLQIRIALGMKF